MKAVALPNNRALAWGIIRAFSLVVVLIWQVPGTAAVAQVEFTTSAKYAILMDSKSGKVIFEKNADELIQPASMSKIMTMLMVFEKLKSGELSLDDKFLISENAWRRGGAPSGGSTMYAEVNTEISLANLIRGVIVQSGNDASIAIAEALAGSEENFAAAMTERARELGLTKSTFKNATGLPDEEHVSTVRELAMLTRYLVEVFPEQYKYYSQTEFTWNDITQRNRNPLLGNYEGADGVKTGYIRAAGYGLIGSAIRGGRRLIVVLSGLKSRGERFREARKLLDYGFRQFQRVKLFSAGDVIGRARVWGGEVSTVEIIPKEDVATLLSKEERATAEAELVYEGPLTAPIRAGQEIGFLRITSDGKFITRQPIYAKTSVPPTESMWRKALDSALFMILGG
jgi:D-alanyl-D-alanine carboxypeptidase (penicillin-binding protein 5/6)